MQNIKKLNSLIEQATSDALQGPSNELQRQILALINCRVDMPKHAIASISKRISVKNKKLLMLAFDLLQFISYSCELSLFTQVSTKEFLFKVSGLLMSKDVDPAVHQKILQTIHCWEELFRPHEDLLPLFFQFEAGLLRKEFNIPYDYVSPYRPKQLKNYTKANKKDYKHEQTKAPTIKASKSEQSTFQSIREKIIITNQIIDNCNPADGVKGNDLLTEMMEEVKGCEKMINKYAIPHSRTINENPNEAIMELALASNDDIYVTYRRFKDLQRNRKPEAFILSELESDIQKDRERQKQSVIKPVSSKPVQPPPPSMGKQTAESPKKEQSSLKDVDILDMDYAPQKQEHVKPNTDLMDLGDISYPPPPKEVDFLDMGPIEAIKQPPHLDLMGDQPQQQMNFMGSQPQQQQAPLKQQPIDLMGDGYSMGNNVDILGNEMPNVSGMSLQSNDFQTQNVPVYGQQNNPIDKLTDFSDFKDFFKKE